MTPSEGFEVWWKRGGTLWPDADKDKMHIAWLAACAFQRERDAEIADTKIGESAKRIATAIREQAGG